MADQDKDVTRNTTDIFLDKKECERFSKLALVIFQLHS